MHPKSTRDPAFETSFYESVLKRDKNYAEVIEILGGLYTEQGRYEEGLTMDRRLVKLRPESPTAHYNLACSLSLMKRRGHALNALRKAVSLGYRDWKHMVNDKDLEYLWEEPAYAQILVQLKTGQDQS